MLHGVYAEELCAQYLTDSALENIQLSGGRVRIVYCPEDNGIRVTTAYDVSRAPNEQERSALIEQTKSQWSDGVGSGSFANHRCQVLSTTLALALKNARHANIGDLFVDVSPLTEEQDIQVQYIEQGHFDDALLADLIQDAKAGSLTAMTNLGERYQAGNGVEQDEVRALELYQQAAERDDPRGITLLGYCYETGIGCAIDRAKASETYQKGIALDSPLAMHFLGEMIQHDNPQESVALYRRGVALGDLGCLAQLGDCYENGIGVEVDLDEALACFRRCQAVGFDVSETIERLEATQGR